MKLYELVYDYDEIILESIDISDKNTKGLVRLLLRFLPTEQKQAIVAAIGSPKKFPLDALMNNLRREVTADFALLNQQAPVRAKLIARLHGAITKLTLQREHSKMLAMIVVYFVLSGGLRALGPKELIQDDVITRVVETVISLTVPTLGAVYQLINLSQNIFKASKSGYSALTGAVGRATQQQAA